MTIPRTTAKKLCTDVEYRLVNESFPPEVKDLSEKALAQRVRRARTARDKYRGLAERQNREARGRITPRSTRASESNRNTIVKQKLFDETLARFERQLGRQDGAPDQPAQSKKTRNSKLAAKAVSKAATPAARKTKIPALGKVVAKVAKAVKARKAEDAAAQAEPKKSTKAPASAGDGAASARRSRSSREAIPGPNPKGPEFPRNPHERGRHSAAFKREQARRDGR